AEAASKAGADALGFVFYEQSPRAVTVDATADWIKKLAGAALRVGVFVNAKIEEIARAVEKCSLDVVQLHGDESPHFISGLKKMIHVRIIRAVRPQPGEIVPMSAATGANYLLLDAYKV